MKKNRGISIIVIVIFISAISLLTASTAIYVAYDDLDISSDYIYSKNTVYIADACLEDSLRIIQSEQIFSNKEYTLSFGGGSCIIKINNQGTYEDIVIEAIYKNYYKEIKAKINFQNNFLDLTAYNLN